MFSRIFTYHALKAKMAQCKVLYVHMTGLSSEILKNLVLAGVKAVICDNRPFPAAALRTPSLFLPQREEVDSIADNDTPKNAKKKQKFFNTVAEAMQQSIEDLNPLLGECEILPLDVDEISDNVLAEFDIVVASRVSMGQAVRITEALKKSKKKGKFFMGDCFGLYGVCCIDLGSEHTYRDDIGKNLLPPKVIDPYVSLHDIFQVALTDAVNRFHKSPPPAWVRYRLILEYVERSKSWPSISDKSGFSSTVMDWIMSTCPSLLDAKDSIINDPNALENLAALSTSEVAPVCAVLGGVISNEVIKAISGKGCPSNNTILFDGLECKTWSFLVQKKA